MKFFISLRMLLRCLRRWAEIAYSDDISGKLTHVGSVAEMENGELTIKINIRYPITTESREYDS